MVSKDEIIEMAREAGLRDCTCAGTKGCLERFAALVADAEAKRIYDEGMVTVGHMREQIAAEREACAKVCEVPDKYEDWEILGGADGRELMNGLAAAIRSRSQ